MINRKKARAALENNDGRAHPQTPQQPQQHITPSPNTYTIVLSVGAQPLKTNHFSPSPPPRLTPTLTQGLG